MTVSWIPIEFVNIVGPLIVLVLAFASLIQSWQWFKIKHDDIFRHYIFLLTLAIVFFAVSRSVGHLIKHILIFSGRNNIWLHISPFSGAVNTASFVVIFSFSLYYQRVKRINQQIENYKTNLENLVVERTAQLEETNVALEETNAALQDEIIERKQVQEALTAEKERLAVTLRSIGDGVITTDTEGLIILTNKVTEQLTGWSQEEAVGRPITEVFKIVDELTGEPRENPVNTVLNSGRIVELANHTTLIAKDGTRFSIADSGAPISDQNSQIIGVVLVFRDVSEKKKLAVELLKAQKLESVGVLAGGIAHDFNNILMAILGNLNLAERFIESGNNEKLRDILKSAEKASLRAKDLTQQLLTFSRGGEPIKKTASIGQIIKDSADFVLHGSKVNCQYNIPNDLWLVVVDPGQISQVVQNLILNARQAMPEGGNILVSCENIDNPQTEDFPALDNGCKYIKITLSDNGPGIPQEATDKIFDPYFTTKREGSGLGLAITNSIISKHGGFINVTSTHQGTTFTIYLPIPDNGCGGQKDISQTQVLSKKSGQDQGKIMVMDDEKMVRDVAQVILETYGYKVVMTKDGQEAVHLYETALKTDEPVDAVIMDLTVPGGMGGKEAAQKILHLDPDAKILVSSGYSNDPIMANYKKYGFRGAIVKPYEMADLKQAVTVILEQNK